MASISKRIDTWAHCDRMTACRLLNLSAHSLGQFERNGDLTPHRSDSGRVFYDRAEVEKIRDERRKKNAELIVVDLNETGDFIVCPPGYDPRVEDEATRHRQDLEMREREFEQRAKGIRNQERILAVVEKIAPKLLEAVDRQSWSHVANTAISAIPSEDRHELLVAVLDVLGGKTG